jgi:hypothetical protein
MKRTPYPQVASGRLLGVAESAPSEDAETVSCKKRSGLKLAASCQYSSDVWMGRMGIHTIDPCAPLRPRVGRTLCMCHAHIRHASEAWSTLLRASFALSPPPRARARAHTHTHTRAHPRALCAHVFSAVSVSGGYERGSLSH